MPTLKTCAKCGHCCRTLWVKINLLDVLREPRLIPYADGWDAMDPDKTWLLHLPCPFLTDENLCSIYSTRPAECVAWLAGQEDRCALTMGRKALLSKR